MTQGSRSTADLRLTVIGEGQEYFDGSEDEILRVLEASADRRADSDELPAHIHDWPTRYHFSRQRANLLRPLTLWRGARVLDVGAGSGTLTRYLGETGADVVALEPTLVRARAAAVRCSDLPNVRVVAGPLDAYQDDDGFDVITCVGVLEYAAATESARQGFLNQVGRFLRPDGTVVLAIENQLGLRYLLGYAEDHLNEPWAGVEDYAGRTGVRTFGRLSLRRVLEDAGLGAQHWLYPFPDYKLPSIIVDERAYSRGDAEELIDKLVRWPASGEASGPARLCDHRQAHRVLLREGLGPDVANSFLVLASRSAESLTRLIPASFLAQHMGSDRLGPWRGSKCFESRGGRLMVSGGGAGGEHRSGWLSRLASTERRFVDGPTVEQLALAACREGVDRLAQVLSTWRGHLRALERSSRGETGSSPFRAGAGSALPAQFLDVVPSNFIQDETGRLHYIDDEWRADGPVDPDLVCTRALFWFATDLVLNGVGHPFGATATVSDVATRMAALAGVAPVDHHRFVRAEADFQARVNGRAVEEWIRELEHFGNTSQVGGALSPRLPFTTLALAAREAAQASDRTTHQNRALEVRLAERETEIAEQNEAIRARDAALTELRTTLADRERELAERDRKLADQDLTLADRGRELADRDRTLVARDQALAERDQALAEHERALAARHLALEAARQEIATLQSRIDRALSDLESSRHQETALRLTAERQQADVERLQSEGAQLHTSVAHLTGELRRLGRVHDDLMADRSRVQEAADQLAGAAASQARAVERLEAARGEVLQRLQTEAGLRRTVESDAAMLRTEVQWLERSSLVKAARRLRRARERVRLCVQLWASPATRALGVTALLRGTRYRQLESRGDAILATGLFDPEWYGRQIGEVLPARASAVHYDLIGRWRGLSPAPLFDTAFYLDRYPDVAQDGVNPLLHYALRGASEGRWPSPLFDSAFYVNSNPELLTTVENPLRHFMRVGATCGRSPSAYFDTAWYLRAYPDVARAGLNPLVHFLESGAKEDRDPGPWFDTSAYLAANPGVAESGMNPLVHFVWHGRDRSGAPAPATS